MFLKKPHHPTGNKFYLSRSKNGRDKIFKTPDDLWKKCCDYFQWVEDNPLKQERVYSGKLGPETIKLNKQRAMTLTGLYVFLGVSNRTYANYKKLTDYKWVTDSVYNIMYSQKFEGAAAGMLNASIIARDLGLVDKRETTADVSITKKNFNDFYDEEKE